MNNLKHYSLLCVLASSIGITAVASAAIDNNNLKSPGERKITVVNHLSQKNGERNICVETWYKGSTRKKCIESNTTYNKKNNITIPTDRKSTRLNSSH